jgi:hypothetical protein
LRITAHQDPKDSFLGCQRGGYASIFIDRYTISVIEKCERLEGVIEEAPKLVDHKNLISIKGMGPVGARQLRLGLLKQGHKRKIE